MDRGLSLTLFFKDTATTRDINKAQIHAWREGIKTIYYIRLRQMALEGTEVEGGASCQLSWPEATESPGGLRSAGAFLRTICAVWSSCGARGPSRHERPRPSPWWSSKRQAR